MNTAAKAWEDLDELDEADELVLDHWRGLVGLDELWELSSDDDCAVLSDLIDRIACELYNSAHLLT